MLTEKELFLRKSFRVGLFLFFFYGIAIGAFIVNAILVFRYYWYVSLGIVLYLLFIIRNVIDLRNRIEHFIETNYTLTDKNILTNQDG